MLKESTSLNLEINFIAKHSLYDNLFYKLMFKLTVVPLSVISGSSAERKINLHTIIVTNDN